MTTSEIENFAHQKLHEYGLHDWKFAFDKARRRLGCCRYNCKTISLSLNLLQHSWREIEDTLLHEIAHALVGPKEGHGSRWKQKAIEIGCNGDRLSRLALTDPTTRVIRCNHCDYSRSFKRFRLPRWITRSRACPRCPVGRTKEYAHP